MIFVVKLRFHEERRSPVIIWLWFSSVCFGKFPKILKICGNFLTDHLKAEKIGVKEAISSLLAILCFLPLPQIWSYEFLLSTGTGEGTNMFNGPANLKRFHLKKRDQSSSKDPHFLYRNYNVLKWNFANVYIWACVNFQNLLLHLLPFGSLFHGVFFSVDLFFRRTQISRRQKIQWSLLKYKLASYLTIILN